MKILKRIALTILIFAIIAFLFRGWLFRLFITYHSIGFRANYTATDNKLVDYIETSVKEESEADIEEIIDLSLSLTSKQLSFTSGRNTVDPNRLITSKTAHCVGYAAFFATTCNHLLDSYKLNDTWIARPRIGQLHFLDINIHPYFDSPFFRDHDFVTIENKKTGQTFAVDPTVNDYLLVDFITFEE